MKAFVITIPDHILSGAAASICVESSIRVGNDFDIDFFDAVVPKQADKLLKEYNIQWNYPWNGEVIDFATGLCKKAYQTANRDARVACALSHYTLWRSCASGGDFEESYLILEHDAIFTSKIDYNIIENSKKLITSINNPLYATRKAREYKEAINKSTADPQGVVTVPYIDHLSIPQGLPGNSAYIIKPAGARKLLQLVDEYGLWPNDALMCRQLIPNIGCTKKFYTRVQGTRSTTSF
jgi:GR25 family glycosyltransferase involved in LPS biosynthesis